MKTVVLFIIFAICSSCGYNSANTDENGEENSLLGPINTEPNSDYPQPQITIDHAVELNIYVGNFTKAKYYTCRDKSDSSEASVKFYRTELSDGYGSVTLPVDTTFYCDVAEDLEGNRGLLTLDGLHRPNAKVYWLNDDGSFWQFPQYYCHPTTEAATRFAHILRFDMNPESYKVTSDVKVQCTGAAPAARLLQVRISVAGNYNPVTIHTTSSISYFAETVTSATTLIPGQEAILRLPAGDNYLYGEAVSANGTTRWIFNPFIPIKYPSDITITVSGFEMPREGCRTGIGDYANWFTVWDDLEILEPTPGCPLTYR